MKYLLVLNFSCLRDVRVAIRRQKLVDLTDRIGDCKLLAERRLKRARWVTILALLLFVIVVSIFVIAIVFVLVIAVVLATFVIYQKAIMSNGGR